MLALAPKTELENAQKMFHREVVALLSQIVVFFLQKDEIKSKIKDEREDT